MSQWYNLFFLFMVFVSLVLVMMSTNPMHSIMWVLVIMGNIGAMLLVMEKHFMCFMLMMVYMGAMTMLFMFIMMMIDESKMLSLSSVKNYTPAMILMLTQTFVMSSVAFKMHWATSNTKMNNENYSFNSQEIINTMSNMLYSEYIICLLAATMILLMGLMASMAMASKITKSKF